MSVKSLCPSYYCAENVDESYKFYTIVQKGFKKDISEFAHCINKIQYNNHVKKLNSESNINLLGFRTAKSTYILHNMKDIHLRLDLVSEVASTSILTNALMAVLSLQLPPFN